MKSIRSWKITALCLTALSMAGVAHGQAKEKTADPAKLPPGMKVERNLEYVERGHARNRLDLYLPEKSTGRLPLVVWVHGGAWMTGSKENPPGLALLGHDYALASINYRFSQHAVFPAQIEDCTDQVSYQAIRGTGRIG